MKIHGTSFASGGLVLWLSFAPACLSQESGPPPLARQALRRTRVLFESKTQPCGAAVFARMGPYAINEYQDVTYRTLPRLGESPENSVRTQAIASIRQYWANEGKWRAWEHDQIVLDFYASFVNGELRLEPVHKSSGSGEDLKPLACNQLPQLDSSESSAGR